MNYQVITEGSIEDSYIFKTFDTNKAQTTKILQFIKGATSITNESIEEQLIQIKRSRMSPLVDVVLAAYEEGRIELLFNRGVKVPVALPFIIRRDIKPGTNIAMKKATVFISNFSTIPANGTHLVIPAKNLYVLMESAYVALILSERPMAIERNYGLMKLLCSIYTTMFTRIMNKEYSLSLNKDLFDDVSYVMSRFFLENIWGLKNAQIVFNTATGELQNPNHIRMKEVDTLYTDADIKDINDALGFIKTLSPRLSTVTVQYIIQRFMTQYQGGAMLAMDYLPYVFYVIINTVLGGFLLNQSTLADIIKEQKNIRSFYQDLSSVIL